MKKENRLRYILPENRTVRIVLAVFFWLLAGAGGGGDFLFFNKVRRMHILAFEP